MSKNSIYLTVKKLFFLLEKKQKKTIFKMMLLSLVSSFFEIVTATSVVILAQVLNTPEMGNHYLTKIGLNTLSPINKVFIFFAIFVGVIYISKNIFSIIEVIFQQRSIQKINYRFKKKLLHKYASMDYSLYLTRNSSEIYSIVSNDADSSFSNGLAALALFFSEFLIFTVLIGMIIFIQPILAFYVFLIISLIVLFTYKIFLPQFFKWGKNLQHYSLESNKNLLQFFYAFKEMILNGKSEVFINRYYEHSKNKSKTQSYQNVGAIFPRIMTESILVIIFVFMIAYFSINNKSPEQMMGILGGYLYIGFRLMPSLNRMITQLNLFKSIVPCINRLHDEYTQAYSHAPFKNIPDFKFNTSILIKNVTFHYANQVNSALKNINLLIQKGECIGITGETGSGKSTLADVILGLLEPQQGSVLIDNKYVVHSEQWHKCIGYVQQAFYLTDDTIEANIAFGEIPERIDENKILEAIRASQLTNFVANLPLGTKTIIGERGIRLSGGERQRIAIARALYKNPDVFVFDEATSALDNETEKELMSTIDEIIKTKKTIIMIAHRLSTLNKCDRIFLMKKGVIDKIITYEELKLLKNIA